MSEAERAPANAGAAGELPLPLTGRRLAILAGVLAAAAVAVAGACSLFGDVALTWSVWTLRLGRLAIAAAVGAALGTGGMALQGLLRNPLADPYILGISSGAGVGVLTGFALAEAGLLAGWLSTPVLALAGALVTCGVVYGIAQRRGRLDPYTLLLAGVIVNAFNGAVMLSIFLFVAPRAIPDFTAWAMGRVSEALPLNDPLLLVACLACILVGWLVVVSLGAGFNALGLGDDVAASTGVSVHRLRVTTFAVVAVMTAAAVAASGPIGFVGLIVPHVCRLVLGPDHRRLGVVSGFAGGMFLMIADTVARKLGGYLRAGDLPVGVLTAFSGGPFFIYLLRRRFREAPR